MIRDGRGPFRNQVNNPSRVGGPVLSQVTVDAQTLAGRLRLTLQAAARSWAARRGRYMIRGRSSRTWRPRSRWAVTAWQISLCCGSSRSWSARLRPTPVVSRLVAALAGDGPRALKAIRAARAAARERAWALAGDAAPGADGGLVTIDLDATIVIAHSEKEQASPTWKKTFGYHPMTAGPTTERTGTGSRWPSCCALGTRGRTRPLTTSRQRAWPWRSCPAGCGARCWSGLSPGAACTSSWTG